jgi:hypothetical protein
LTDFQKKSPISKLKEIQVAGVLIQTDRQTGRQAGRTMLTGAFCDYVAAPKNSSNLVILHIIQYIISTI